MTSLTLKSYQQAALGALAAFARAARIKGPAAAFAEHAGCAYNADAFGTHVPCVCLRIPTGGGKTVLAAHAVFGWLTKQGDGQSLAQQLNAVMA